MEMPQKCGQCKLFHAEHPMHCMAVEGYRTVGAPYGMPRPDWCPLVEVKEPHGRLIDATFEENHYASMLLDPTPDVTEQDKHKARIIIEALRMAGTVVEAEGSETDA
jgi:hypothetical protein